MAKFYGAIGFIEHQETAPGVYEPTITERNYSGDVLRSSRRLEPKSDHVTDDINISNQFSILSDKYVYNHVYCMKYITYMGTKWEISDVEINHPRMTLTVGGVYNGD